MKRNKTAIQVKLDSTTVATLKALVLQIDQARQEAVTKRQTKHSTSSEAGQMSLFDAGTQEGGADH